MNKDSNYINIQTGEELDWDRVEVLKDNSMLKVKPELWVEWDFEKNNEIGLDIYEVTKGSRGITYWYCEECKDNYDARIAGKMRGGNCPYCAGKRVKIGRNDLWTTHPHIAKLLLNSEVGYSTTFGASLKADWKCDKCSSVIRNKAIYHITKRGLSCPICSGGKSYAEKFIFNLIKLSQFKTITENTFSWSKGKRYDFYLPSINTIVEVHGKQHYVESISSLSGVSLAQEQENDRLKEELAKENEIENYIVIDARDIRDDYLINAIKTSKILEILNLHLSYQDFMSIASKSQDSNYLIVGELYKNGLDKYEIAKQIGYKPDTIRKIIKKLSKLGVV